MEFLRKFVGYTSAYVCWGRGGSRITRNDERFGRKMYQYKGSLKRFNLYGTVDRVQ